MVNPKILAGVGVGVLVLLLVCGILWQANKLISVGQENGTLKAENAALKLELTEKAEAVRLEIIELERVYNECNGALTSTNFIAATWEAKYRQLKDDIPSMEAAPIVIEAEGCAPALLQGAQLAAVEIERLLGGSNVSP